MGDEDDDGPGGGGGPGPGGGGDGVVEPAPGTRFPRLTHEQWERTVRTLFRLDATTGMSEGFRSDPGQAGYLFDNNGQSLSVDEALWAGYQRAAVDLAEDITSDPARLEAILPPDDGEARARAERFVRSFGKRAHRRPLTDMQVDEYMALYDAAPALYDGMDPFDAGIRLMLEAFLQSPYFLYRVEQSTNESDGVVPLDGWEIAARLSYFLWDSMPDEELFSLAESGALEDPEVVASQAERMLEDDEAEHVLLDYHRQLLDVDKFESIRPSDTF
ncbi:MAG: DUF1592 domain-containing protein, partial [Polyangiales bacterium]